MFTLTPELLQKGLTGLGIAAGQLKHIDEETRKALGRFALRAVGSGDANGYVKEALRLIEERDTAPSKPKASARVVRIDGELVDPPPSKGRRR